jgi:hypothetical protein
MRVFLGGAGNVLPRLFRYLSIGDIVSPFFYLEIIMKFAFIPKAQYRIGQLIKVHGKPMRVESYTHTGKNVTVHTLEGAPRFERIVCICTDAQPIQGA